MIDGPDFFPTVLELCGQTPDGVGKIDGASFMPVINDVVTTHRSHSWQQRQDTNGNVPPTSTKQAISNTADWKLITIDGV